MTSCKSKVVNPDRQLTLDDYSAFSSDSYALNSRRIRNQLDRLAHEDNDSMAMDKRVKSYYLNHHDFLWIDRRGVDNRADTLLACLDSMDQIGLSKKKFRVEQIAEDLKRVRTLDFDTANSINKVMARLEYNLTKAYARYVTGQRFGFTNPNYELNRMDTLQQNPGDKDRWTSVHYRTLFGLKMQHPGKHFHQILFSTIAHDSVGVMLREAQPMSPMFHRLQKKLNSGSVTAEERMLILCNMERCRWRLEDYPQKHNKYVVVNIPSMQLMAVDGDDMLTMRVGCGSKKTKSPLLSSNIQRMDINPRWIMPRSIIERDVINHAGDSGYFARNHYFVKNKKTGKRVPVRQITRALLLNRDYSVMQEGGEGNSLGRIIFRFNNDFSVFLHSTSSIGVFSRDERDVSHGCIRVEKPFELATFMLEDKDDKLIEKIHYSMTANLSSLRHSDDVVKTDDDEEIQDTLRKDMLVYSLPVRPVVPVFLLYFTMYPNPKTGVFETYNDIYGYDAVIWNQLQNYH